MRIILASGSPRRKELLKKIYKDFEIITSDADENITCDDPGKMVEELACRKARAVLSEINNGEKTAGEDALILGADTIVYYDGEVLGKPSDEAEAKSMIAMLSERTHQVYTGVCIIAIIKGQEKTIKLHDVTDVTFSYVDKFDIEEYVKGGSPMDKAGAYGIQDDFAKHVRKINGDYNNVVGLPVAKIYDTLKENRLPLHS